MNVIPSDEVALLSRKALDRKVLFVPELDPSVAGRAAVDVELELAALEHLRVEGLMTMGPWTEDPEEVRPYLRRTRELFDHLSEKNIPNVTMRHLSMGMSDSYLVAIEEGASMVRIGTRLFGPR